MNFGYSICAVLAASFVMTPINAKERDAFDIAIDNGDMVGAAKYVDHLRIQPKSPKRSFDLDIYYGRFFAAAGQGAVAEPYLRRAILQAKIPANRDELMFELARTHEVDGLVEQAEVDYRKLINSETEISVRRNATLAIARLRLGVSSAEAIDLLLPLAEEKSPVAVRWESHLLLSRAYAIEGRSQDSKAMLEAAWHEAPFAPIPANAITVTAMDMAIDGSLAGDRSAEVGLISVDKSSNRFAGKAQIPVCSSALKPEDWVTVAVAADPKQRPIYSLVRASRPNIGRLFTVPLAAAQQQVFGSAFSVTLRCLTAPDSSRRFSTSMHSLPTWLADQAIYPAINPIDPNLGDPVTQIKGKLEVLEKSAGPTSPELTPLLLQLSFLQAQRFPTNADVFAQAKGSADRAIDILTKSGAPAEIIEQVRMQMTFVFAQNQNIADVAGPAASGVFDAMVARSSTTPAQMIAALDWMGGWQLKPTQRLMLIDRLIAFLEARKVPADDPIRQIVELRRAKVLREIGTISGMSGRLAASGIAPELCATADRLPSFPPAAITLTAEDYPKDLLRGGINGLTGVELSVDASGKIVSQRVVISQPSTLFDAVTIDKLKVVNLLAAQRDDKPVPCIGMVQTVRWQIPFQGDFSPEFPGVATNDE